MSAIAAAIGTVLYLTASIFGIPDPAASIQGIPDPAASIRAGNRPV